MKIEYILEPNTKIIFKEYESDLAQFNMDGAEVNLIITQDNILKKIIACFLGLPIKQKRDGTIDGHYPETTIIAYKIFSYISNRILIQTSQDAFNLESVLHMYGKVSPETEVEKEIFQNNKQRVISSLTSSYSIFGYANLTDYDNKYLYSGAFSNFTDGLRTNNLITKFEQYYKIIETFFNKTGTTLDQQVSNYACRFDPSFTQRQVETLRLLRNRCMHPQHNHGHISSENIELLNEVTLKVGSLEKLARLLLENPPR